MTPVWVQALTVIAAALAAAAAIAVPLTTYWRRPRLSIHADEEGVHTRLEGANNDIPWIRLVVANGRRRRAAQGTRVLVEQYRELAVGANPIALGSPELSWPSTEVPEGGGVVVFAGGERPLDFAVLERPAGSVQPEGGGPARYGRDPQWWLRLNLSMHARGLVISNRREFLAPRPNGYSVRLVVGADDGAARRFEVVVSWAGDAPDAAAAIRSVRIAVREL